MANASYVGVNGVARKISKKYVGVDGVARKISKGYVGVDGVARKFVSGEPWEEALSMVGTSAASLDALLKNSSACTALANNSSALSIMANNYASQISSYVSNESYFTDGLNYLAYKTGKCRFYAYRVIGTSYYLCTNIVGGWYGYNYEERDAYTTGSGTYRGLHVGEDAVDGGSLDYRCYTTKAIVDRSKYRSISFNTIWFSGGDTRGGLNNSVPTSSYTNAVTIDGWGTRTASWSGQTGMMYIHMGYNGSDARCIINAIWVDP